MQAKVQALLRLLSSTTFYQVQQNGSVWPVPCGCRHGGTPAARIASALWNRLAIRGSDGAHLPMQALVFLNAHEEGQALADQLCRLGYPATFVSGAHAQASG